MTCPGSSSSASQRAGRRFPRIPLADRALTAPGVTVVVSLDGDRLVGFAYMLSDGEIQAHLANITVASSHRRRGIARRLISDALQRAGGVRVDLITDTAEAFYESLHHKRSSGYRIYPPFTSEAASGAVEEPKG